MPAKKVRLQLPSPLPSITLQSCIARRTPRPRSTQCIFATTIQVLLACPTAALHSSSSLAHGSALKRRGVSCAMRKRHQRLLAAAECKGANVLKGRPTEGGGKGKTNFFLAASRFPHTLSPPFPPLSAGEWLTIAPSELPLSPSLALFLLRIEGSEIFFSHTLLRICGGGGGATESRCPSTGRLEQQAAIPRCFDFTESTLLLKSFMCGFCPLICVVCSTTTTTTTTMNNYTTHL